MIKGIKVALSAARLAYLIAWEDGPFNLADNLRMWVVTRFGLQSWVSAGISCPFCLSFWLAGILWLAPNWALNWLATAEISRQLLNGKQ